ncbi:MAG: glycosyltransferase [Gaiellales bacterium]
MKVLVLTTSYPRTPDDSAGVFVAEGVDALRAGGLDVTVVSPSSFRHFGIAYGDGIVNNLRRAPWRALLLPAFFVSFLAATRRASRGVDLVHAHWLPSMLPALAVRKPVVAQLWGSDAALAMRMPWLSRRLLRRAVAVVCASESLARDARALGARDVSVVPGGVKIPEAVVAPAEPSFVLYIGRLSREKGVEELAEAAHGLPLVVIGDGPLRGLFPEARGAVPPAEVGGWLDQAAVVVVPSRREGYGMVAREAMAHGRAVVATDAGGLRDAIIDNETGLVVPVGDPEALRVAIRRLLGDPALRARLGAAARGFAVERFGWETAVRDLIGIYRAVLD